MEQLAEKLDFPFKRNGSLVLCLDEKDYPNLQKLYDRGIDKWGKGASDPESEMKCWRWSQMLY